MQEQSHLGQHLVLGHEQQKIIVISSNLPSIVSIVPLDSVSSILGSSTVCVSFAIFTPLFVMVI